MFIAVDLKVIEGLAASTARLACCHEDRVLAGLNRMWHRCWSDNLDVLTVSMLAGIFGGERIDQLIEGLVTFGFLEPRGDASWRVKGAERYLRLKESRRSGAKRTNDARKREKGENAQLSDALERPGATLPPTLKHALSPNTEHRTPNTEKVEEPATPPKPVRPPPKNPLDKFASAESFWAWAQFKRSQVGLVAESPPHPSKLSGWWSEVHLELNGDPTRLEPAFFKFAESKHWESRDPPLPFYGFIAKWRDFAPAKRNAG